MRNEKRLSQRITSFMLAMLMFLFTFADMPVVSAEPDEEEATVKSLVVVVRDTDGNAISDADVKVKTASVGEMSAVSDSSGEAEFSEFFSDTVIDDITVEYEVSCSGYLTNKGSVDVNAIKDSGKLNKVLLKEGSENEITLDYLGISGTTVTYNEGVQSLVKLDPEKTSERSGYDLKYRVNLSEEENEAKAKDASDGFYNVTVNVYEKDTSTLIKALELYSVIEKRSVQLMFSNSEIDEKVDDPQDYTINNKVSDTGVTGVEYSIVEDTCAVNAVIDSGTGELTFKSEGSVVVKAEAADTTNYKYEPAYYTATVNKKNDSENEVFEKHSFSILLKHGDESKSFGVAFSNSGNKDITIEIDNEDVVKNNSLSGEKYYFQFLAVGPGKATVKAYSGSELLDSFEVNVTKQYNLEFSDELKDLTVGDTVDVLKNVPAAIADDLKYEVGSGCNIENGKLRCTSPGNYTVTVSLKDSASEFYVVEPIKKNFTVTGGALGASIEGGNKISLPLSVSDREITLIAESSNGVSGIGISAGTVTSDVCMADGSEAPAGAQLVEASGNKLIVKAGMFGTAYIPVTFSKSGYSDETATLVLSVVMKEESGLYTVTLENDDNNTQVGRSATIKAKESSSKVGFSYHEGSFKDQLSYSNEGKCTNRVYVQKESGEIVLSDKCNFAIDTTGPKATKMSSAVSGIEVGGDLEAGYTFTPQNSDDEVSPVKAKIFADDIGTYTSGIKRFVIEKKGEDSSYSYWSDATDLSGSGDTYQAFVTVNEEGEYRVYAVDKAGNKSNAIKFTAKIDGQKPTVVISKIDDDTVQVQVTDNNLKVSSFEGTITKKVYDGTEDGGDIETTIAFSTLTSDGSNVYTASASLTGPGIYHIQASCKDDNGNPGSDSKEYVISDEFDAADGSASVKGSEITDYTYKNTEYPDYDTWPYYKGLVKLNINLKKFVDVGKISIEVNVYDQKGIPSGEESTYYLGSSLKTNDEARSKNTIPRRERWKTTVVDDAITGLVGTGVVEFQKDGYYVIKVKYDDVVFDTVKFCVDNNSELTSDNKSEFISYEFVEPRITDVVLNNLTFGLYKPTVNAKVYVRDDITDVQRIGYYLTDVDGNDLTTEETVDVSGYQHKTREITYDGKTYTVYYKEIDISFEPGTFVGRLVVKAYDGAGNDISTNVCENFTSASEDKKLDGLAVDKDEPVISFTHYADEHLEFDSYVTSYKEYNFRIIDNLFDQSDNAEQIIRDHLELTLNDGAFLYSSHNIDENDRSKVIITKESDTEYSVKYIYDEYGYSKLTAKYTDLAGNSVSSMQKKYIVDAYAKYESKVSGNALEGSSENTYIGDVQYYFRSGSCISTDLLTAKVTVTDVNGNSVIGEEDSDTFKAYNEKLNDYIHDNNNWNTGLTEITIKDMFTYEGRYDVRISYKTGKSTSKEVSSAQFIVDSKKPIDLSLKVKDITVSETFDLTELDPKNFVFFKNIAYVAISAFDKTSGIDRVEYVRVDAVTGKKYNGTFKPGDSGVSVTDGVLTCDLDVPPNYRGDVVIKVFDKAGNYESASLSGMSEKQTLVVDDKEPDINVEYENEPEEFGQGSVHYFNGKRTATITIAEKNYFNDDKITVKVGKRYHSDEEYIYKEYPLELDSTDKKDPKYTCKIEFTEDAEYSLEIKAADYSGNSSSYEKEFIIDTVEPVFTVEYDNNDVYSEGEEAFVNAGHSGETYENKYYKADRTATFTLVERYPVFTRIVDDKYYLNTDILVRTDGTQSFAAQNIELEFTKTGADTYTATYEFKADETALTRDFKDFKAAIKDTTDHAAEITDTFTVDKKAPEIDIVFDNNEGRDGTEFYKGDRKATMSIDEANFDADDVVLVIRKNGKAIEKDLKWKDGPETNGNHHVMTYDFKDDADYDISLDYTDQAGNAGVSKDTSFTVDKTAPVIKVSYDNNSVLNDKYFKADRTATIEITEHNFDLDKLEDVVITVTLDGTEDSRFADIVHDRTKWTSDGDVHTVKITYDENVDYTFDISYTDLANNKNNGVDYGGSAAPTIFTVDKIDPVIKISYDNNSVQNGKYFKENRTATIEITEHNFNTDIQDAVIRVTRGGAEDSRFRSLVDSKGNWTNSGDTHTIVIPYTEDADYEFRFSYTDLAGNGNSGIDYGSSAAPEEFTIDKVAPTGSVSIGTWGPWNAYNTSYNYSRWSRDPVNVQITNADSLSGVFKAEYFRAFEVYTEAQLRNVTNWSALKTGTDNFSVSPNEKFIVYAHFVDMAGNELYISSNGVIVDNAEPVVEKEAPEITLRTRGSANDIYNQDVNVDVVVIDTVTAGNTYSGLKSVTYEVTNMGKTTQSGELFTFSRTDAGFDDLVQRFERNSAIRVNSAQNNSNEVEVKVTAVDNAGNTSSKVLQLKIDVTAPRINVSYDNNDVQNGKYFKNERTATIQVTERNFSGSDVKLSVETVGGVVPQLSSWSRSGGGGNGDSTVWTATLTYAADGDYTFDISCNDTAGNPSGDAQFAQNTAAGKEFTVDKTLPIFEISYDNNDYRNSNYYKATREAELTIREHNFNDSKVVITQRSTLDGKEIADPAVSKWEKDGDDTYKATIKYDKDGHYEFGITYTDEAGNEIEKYAGDDFHIDLTTPAVSIGDVKAKKSYNGKIAPSVSFSDINYDAGGVTLVLTGANSGQVFTLTGRNINGSDNINGAVADANNGTVFTFNNFKEIKAVDDIYTLTAVITDLAGNTNTASVVFSVNRFGSTYEFSEDIEKINNKFTKDPQDIVITEINGTELKNIDITVFKNNETIVLKEGSDYSIEKKGGDGEWYEYKYTIYKKNFEDDGVYRISVHSEDEAGNVSENTLDNKNKEITFAVDNTPPDIIVTNLEDGKTYPVTNMTVRMSVADNIQLKNVVVYLDGEEYKKWGSAEIERMLSANEDFLFDIPGTSNSAHVVRIIGTDNAGNAREIEIKDFYVTTNFWIRFYTNKPLFFGVLGGLAVLIGLVIFLIIFRKKDKDKR